MARRWYYWWRCYRRAVVLTIKTGTKLAFILVLVVITCVPIFMWAAYERDLTGVAGFIAACAAPMGVLTGAMAARGISRERSTNAGQQGTP